MKRPIYAVLIVLLLATLACSINITLPTMKVGPTKTFTVNEPIPSGSSTAVLNINMGAGSLDLSGGTSALVKGTITYNIPEWDPKVTQSDNAVTITQGEQTNITGVPSDKLINNWVLKVNDTNPLDLSIKAGAYKGSMDLSGLHLSNLSIMDGASQNTVTFKTPNPKLMSNFSYKTGASQVELDGLANANFTNMQFDGGAGQYTFDFSGTLNQDAHLTIKTGISSINIDVPADMSVTFINSGAVSNITTTGTWTVNGNTYRASGEGHLLTIDAQIAVGSIKLNRK